MKKYSGFTLIEMLIVMGIIIILMAAGVAGGRFAIQRANRIQKQNAVGNIEQALWGFYTDQRNFPQPKNAQALLTNDETSADPADRGVASYLDAGQWDGGSDASYWYFVTTPDHQTFVVCVSLGGPADVQGSGNANYGIYCSGNGMDQMTDIFGEAGARPADNIFTDKNHPGIRTQILGSTTNKSDWESGSW